MPRLDDFRDMIDNTDDANVLESGQTLLREMIEIASLKERLLSLENGLTEGGKAIFYFFAEELDEDEIVFAAERLTGKLRRVKRALDAAEKDAEKDADDGCYENYDTCTLDAAEQASNESVDESSADEA